MIATFSNKRTLTHEFFVNESHFVNYCLKVCRTSRIKDRGLTTANLKYFAWSLSHESVFKRSSVKPPYAVLMCALKKNDPVEIRFLLSEYTKELIDLRAGNKTLDNCEHIPEYQICNEDVFSGFYENWGFNPNLTRIFKTIEDKSGVYKLYDKNKDLIYIGKSYTLGKRIPASIKERNAFYVRIMLTDTQADANLLELLFISEEKPSMNDAGLTFDKLTITVSHKYHFSKILNVFTKNIL